MVSIYNLSLNIEILITNKLNKKIDFLKSNIKFIPMPLV